MDRGNSTTLVDGAPNGGRNPRCDPRHKLSLPLESAGAPEQGMDSSAKEAKKDGDGLA